MPVNEQATRREGSERKVFAGPRVRHLRLSLGLSQTAMARDLGISASYLNLVERNQRPLTTQLVLKLAAIYELDLRELHGDREAERVAELGEIFADPVFAKAPSATVMADLVNGYPDVTSAFVSLYSAYRKALTQEVGSADADWDAGGPPEARYPIEEIRRHFQSRNNHIASLDLAAEALHSSLAAADDLFPALQTHLRETHNVRVTVLPIHALPDAQRRYDRHNRRLFLSELLPAPARIFQTAVQVALLSYAEELDRLVAEAMPGSSESGQLLRLALANYFAGALMMPYGRFLGAAASARYDMVVLAGRFGAGIEQVARRLTTLQRSENRGVPFFLLRIDNAGNVLTQIPGGGYPFPRFGGICPRWRVYETFAAPDETLVQPILLPDGSSYLTISRTIETIPPGHGATRRRLAIALGCPASFAKSLVYGDGIDFGNSDALTPTGVTCRVCERVNCPKRMAPLSNAPFKVDVSRKSLWPFEFA